MRSYKVKVLVLVVVLAGFGAVLERRALWWGAVRVGAAD